ncbi:MAG: metal-dependent transcriptional regulator [Oscillospiraceae bacterium]|nr:metal-dependent transcriptional regulator [Oscillospiraceae bacterium]
MQIYESGEMYLETILILSQKLSFVRSIDVADYMGFSKPSVSRAMGILRRGEYITVDKDGYISLTESGKAVAEKIYDRHTTLTEFIAAMGVDRETAAADACKIEHDISEKTFDAIKAHVEKHS